MSQREIKFRAWDSLTKKINPVTNIEVSRLNGMIDLMQFTGLLDKSGKEIYEGDILVAKNRYDKEMIGKIYFDNGCFKVNQGYRFPEKDERKDYFLSGSFVDSFWEVIGNIYENKELLNEKSKNNRSN